MKKILLLGDIHANYPALKAIQTYIRPDRFDRIVNTGDFTVYSTFPNETIQWFRKRKKNHLHIRQYGSAGFKDPKRQATKKTKKKRKAGHVLLDI